MRGRTTVIALTALASVFGVTVASSGPTPGAPRPKRVHLEAATLIIETNQTDGDAGLQIFLDGEAWRKMTLVAPDGRRMLAINGRTRLRNWGLTELFSESSEPPFTKFPLNKFKKLFPEGRYKLVGETIHGQPLVGSARLSHDIPNGPQITAPADGSTVPDADLTASWSPASQPQGITITGYRVVIESDEEPVQTFSVDVPASVTGVTIPDEYLKSVTKYGLEVQAIDASGNQTLTSVEFSVS